MNDHQLLFWLPLVSAPLALIACGFLAVVAFQERRSAGSSLAAESGTAKRLAAVERKLDEVARQAAERAGRIAWLEARARRERVEEPPVAEPEPVSVSRPSMTERRHRVLSLAHRGMDAETIAE